MNKIMSLLGPAGTLSHEAFQFLRKNVPNQFGEPVFIQTISKAVELLKLRMVSYALVPVENSTVGLVSETLELLRSDFYEGDYRCLFAEALVEIPVSYCLRAIEGTNMAQVKVVYSKRETLLQCKRTLWELLGYEVCFVETQSTAEAVTRLQDGGQAALVSENFPTNFSLLARGVEDVKANATKFYLLSVVPPDNRPWRDNTRMSLLYTLPHEVGALHKVTEVLNTFGWNINTIHSLATGSPGDYLFFMECESTIMGVDSQNTLRPRKTHFESVHPNLSRFVNDLWVLGSMRTYKKPR